jgi:FG-GAP repeat protein
MNNRGILRAATFTSRTLLASTFVALAFLSSSPAAAELPQHVRLQTLLPTAQDGPDVGPENTEFGFDVAIRNGLAFVGMISDITGRTGRVAVFTQGTSGWVRTATITASDKTSGDFFGRAISYRDGLLVVGSNRAAYVYRRINGVWREQQKIVPPAADGVRVFSTDLKHEAGVLAIGAFANDTARDSVYVFEQDATGKFVRRARIGASDSRPGDAFGTSISMTNRIIVVGAPGQNAAYILARNSSGTWIRRQKLVSAATGLRGGFGTAVAVDRDMILVGAPGAEIPGGEAFDTMGAVVGFLPGTGRYVESFQLYPDSAALPPDSGPYWVFGTTIAMFGDRIAVGATQGGVCDCIPPAIITTYSREGSSVLPLGHVHDLSARARSIAIANYVLLTGAPRDIGSDDLQFSVGSAHLYHLNLFE